MSFLKRNAIKLTEKEEKAILSRHAGRLRMMMKDDTNAAEEFVQAVYRSMSFAKEWTKEACLYNSRGIQGILKLFVLCLLAKVVVASYVSVVRDCADGLSDGLSLRLMVHMGVSINWGTHGYPKMDAL